MSSGTGNKRLRSAAWRISLWATLAFAFGTMVVFVGLHQFVANDIQRRSDAWLSGEVEVLGDVAERTPKDRLYERVVGEVAELASREVPNKSHDEDDEKSMRMIRCFFCRRGRRGLRSLWVGRAMDRRTWRRFARAQVTPDVPFHLNVKGVCDSVSRGGVRGSMMGALFIWGFRSGMSCGCCGTCGCGFCRSGLLIVLLGLGLCFIRRGGCWGMCARLRRRRRGLGESDLSQRVPTTEHNDELGSCA